MIWSVEKSVFSQKNVNYESNALTFDHPTSRSAAYVFSLPVAKGDVVCIFWIYKQNTRSFSYAVVFVHQNMWQVENE